MSYPFERLSEDEYFFISKGPKGEVKKFVSFSLLYENIYNVSLESEINGIRMDDLERTNNGDVFKVLNTVVKIIKHELRLKPRRGVFLCGSDRQRTKIYQRRALIGEPGLFILGQAAERSGCEFLSEHKDYKALLIFIDNPII
jgi:hypothetical protein